MKDKTFDLEMQGLTIDEARTLRGAAQESSEVAHHLMKTFKMTVALEILQSSKKKWKKIRRLYEARDVTKGDTLAKEPCSFCDAYSNDCRRCPVQSLCHTAMDIFRSLERRSKGVEPEVHGKLDVTVFILLFLERQQGLVIGDREELLTAYVESKDKWTSLARSLKEGDMPPLGTFMEQCGFCRKNVVTFDGHHRPSCTCIVREWCRALHDISENLCETGVYSEDLKEKKEELVDIATEALKFVNDEVLSGEVIR